MIFIVLNKLILQTWEYMFNGSTWPICLSLACGRIVTKVRKQGNVLFNDAHILYNIECVQYTVKFYLFNDTVSTF